MSVGDWAGVIGGVAGVAGAVVALVSARSANKLVKEGNALAQAANDTAADALRETKEANRVAVEANELAGDANSVAQRALHVAQDDVPYSWVLQVDDDGLATVTNDCGHPAHEVVVILDSGGHRIADTGPVDVPAFGKVTLDAKGTIEQHYEEVRKHPARYAHVDGPLMFGGSAGKPVATTFRAHVRWLTAEQVPRHDVVEEIISHYMGYEGIERSEPGRGSRKGRS